MMIKGSLLAYGTGVFQTGGKNDSLYKMSYVVCAECSY
jgi:hypothetical protein